MSPFKHQLAKEARYDVRVALVWLALFFGCMAVLPRGSFWCYFLPMIAFWLRYLFVRDTRDEALLRADSLLDAGNGSPRCYRTERGICISDGTHHYRVLGNESNSLLKLTHVVRDE
jgi:hypothetical protein